MPIYEYLCDDCGTAFEKLVRGDAQVNCPACGETHLTAQMSTFAARGNGIKKEAAPATGCGSGMCATPGLCGRN